MSGRRATLAALVALAAACGPPPPEVGTAAAPSRAVAGTGLRDDRVVIGSGAVVRAVGVSRRFVYAATNDVVAVYDRDRRAWLPAFTRDGGFDPAQVRSIATDPDDDSAWLFTAVGAWTLQPLTAFVMRAPAGPAPSRLRVGSLDAVYREFPAVESFGRLLTRDDATLLPWPAVSGARAPDRAEVWLGTAGGGLYQVDPLFNRAERRPFGLATSGAGAIARDADRIWVAPAARSGDARAAITVLSRDLQDVRWIDDAPRRNFGFARATALAVRSGTAWMGTTVGLFRLSGAGASVLTPLSGLPSELVLSLLARRDGLWVGTDRGAVFVADDAAASATTSASAPRGRAPAVPVPSALDQLPVRAMIATGDTIWFGTTRGLALRTPNAETLTAPASEDASMRIRLRLEIRALAASDSMLFVALDNTVLAFNRKTGVWSEPWMGAAWLSVGGIESLVADGTSVWAGGPFGVLALNRRSGGSRALHAPSDLPDAVTGLVLDGPWAWVATLGGVVRIRRAADGLVP